ncbi:acyltransferase family protein [Caulobacter sp. UNC279MFTsu5.1]|uniref:acyltransferase family protein n=1 Tax=Caulobacter sp. UNC279MFTsu5.1 TaxID=1502775 RepID=UPI00036A1AFD|nr:acyltransferase family protein [Caulobacter sp. UNC279MFTsu5.1]SFJ40041.1 Peptidoglycan/LPS O-acetylase OafA/YrhL, contains acyltransferase and SGNH-hydrolase domains [Caulobacter sp. UNC279MFTsu5.1]
MIQEATLDTSRSAEPDSAPIAWAGAYRPDIDGMRAIAVLAVVVFHAGFSGVFGGFIGVDVFFVISGYLIGGQVFREAVAGEFRFSRFYARRVRRILPALYVLLAVMFGLGALLLTPLELRELGKEAFAAIFGASNLLFYTAGGYFDPASDHLPLLMSWSLGVEEQFYIVFPILVLLCLKIRPRLFMPVLVLGTLVSFAGSIVLTHLNPKAAFYLLPTRAWELGLGAILALSERRSSAWTPPRPVADVAAFTAVAALAAAMALYRPAYAFPGWYALIPTIAAAILIATPDSLLNRKVLSWSPFVFIGKISYSWYLWHWPLFFLNRILAPDGKGLPPAALLILSVIPAAASWRWVEQPFRRRVLGETAVLARYGVVAALIALPALFFFLADGWPGRFSPAVRQMSRTVSEARTDPCLAPYGAVSPQNPAACLPTSAAPRVLVLGDSHGSAIAPGFKALAAREGFGFGQITKSSCPPLWGFAREIPGRVGHLAQCQAFQREAFAYVERHPEIEVVVLASYWPSDMILTDGKGADVPLADALDDTVARLTAARRRVILVDDVPTFRFDPYGRIVGDLIPARAMAQRWFSRTPGVFAARGDEIFDDPATAVLRSTAKAHPAATFFDTKARLCGAEGCRYGAPGALYYFDFQHLTATGAGVATGDFTLRPPAASAGNPTSGTD